AILSHLGLETHGGALPASRPMGRIIDMPRAGSPCPPWSVGSTSADIALALCRRRARSRTAHPPDDIADIIGDEQRAVMVERHADRPSQCIAVLVEEAGQHIDRRPGR